MWDLDLLVPGDDLEAAVRQLEACGYRRWPPRAKASAHEIVVEREGDPGPIELHFELGDRTVTSALSTAEALGCATPHVRDDARLLLLSPTHAVVHNVVHAEAQDFDHAIGAIPVRQLHTFVTIARHHGAVIDWTEVRTRTDRLLEAHAELAHFLFGFDTPGVSPGWRALVHRWRCVATLSVPGAADAQRNLRFAFDAEYLRQRYGSGTTTSLRLRHARTLWRERGRAVLDDALVPRAR
jgi:hypothetical protein